MEGCHVKGPCNPDLDKNAAIKKGFEDMQTMIPAWEDLVDPRDSPENACKVNWEDAAAVEFFGSFQKTAEHRSSEQKRFAIANANGTSSLADIMQCSKFEYAAYTSHREETYDHINFCGGYFRQGDLAEALDFGFQPAYHDSIIPYQNKGCVLFYQSEFSSL
ncbi:hypothetical protein P154DRAFT_530524 [Amniculicola lignicola CBS 123094]|uniref:Uncharacterized protein n=1 Tax=Amniculicola lignicola CBS 123094 TaxID=1392246 RepID=A0A6A5WV98_9PLEO|nr:hypothetical protein P154DRAFT_530524 [Amniculicola lignicola CBS 123094]